MKKRLDLAAPRNLRNSTAASKDIRYINCFLDTRGKRKYRVKRRGCTAVTYENGSAGQGIMAWLAAKNTIEAPTIITAFGLTNSNIYQGTSAGVYVEGVTGGVTGITETMISGVPTFTITTAVVNYSTYAITANHAYYTDDNAIDTTLYTGNTNSTTTISGIASTAGMVVGQRISGSGIPLGATIATIAANSITISSAATSTANGVSLYVYQNVFTGDTHSNTTIDGITSTTGILVGQTITGSGIPANTRVASVNSATAITITNAATATATVSLTRSILGKITDTDFPANQTPALILAGTFAHMDGYAFIMTTNGKLWASDLNSLTAWTATSFDTANSRPDRGIGCFRNKNTILAFCTAHVECFYNAGLTPFPLAKIPQQTFQLGIHDITHTQLWPHNAVTQVADTIFFAAAPPEGGLAIFKYEGTVEKLSDLDWFIDNVYGPAFVSISAMRIYGKTFIFVKGPVSTNYLSVMVYCVEEDFWDEWVLNTATSMPFSLIASVPNAVEQFNYSLDADRINGINPGTGVFDGKVFKWSNNENVFTDDGTAFTATIQTANDDFGTTDRKFFPALELVCDKESSTSTATISYSDDDYGTWTTAGTVDLSTSRPRLTRLGSSYKRAWKLEHSSNTPFRIEAIELEVTK